MFITCVLINVIQCIYIRAGSKPVFEYNFNCILNFNKYFLFENEIEKVLSYSAIDYFFLIF